MMLWMQSEDARIACGEESLPNKITKSLIEIFFFTRIRWCETFGKKKYGIEIFAVILIRGRK